jgi:hypothetical protein
VYSGAHRLSACVGPVANLSVNGWRTLPQYSSRSLRGRSDRVQIARAGLGPRMQSLGPIKIPKPHKGVHIVIT